MVPTGSQDPKRRHALQCTQLGVQLGVQLVVQLVVRRALRVERAW